MADEVFYKISSKDDGIFYLSKKAAQFSSTIKEGIENCGLDNNEAIKNMQPLPLPGVDGDTFDLVHKWLEKHRDCKPYKEDAEWWENEPDSEMAGWETNFLAECKDDQLYDLFMAADYLDIKSLVERCAEAFAAQVKDKSKEEIEKMWDLKCDFTEAQLKKIRKENPWDVILKHQEKNQ